MNLWGLWINFPHPGQQPFPPKLQEQHPSTCRVNCTKHPVLLHASTQVSCLPHSMKPSLNLNPSLGDICPGILIFAVQRWRPQQPAWLPWPNKSSFTKLLCREREDEQGKAHVCCKNTRETANSPRAELQMQGTASWSALYILCTLQQSLNCSKKKSPPPLNKRLSAVPFPLVNHERANNTWQESLKSNFVGRMAQIE